MLAIAKVFTTGNSQAVRLPKASSSRGSHFERPARIFWCRGVASANSTMR